MIKQIIKEYDTCIVCYSGGKDSTAALAWCVERLAHHMRVVAVLADTACRRRKVELTRRRYRAW